VGGREEGQRDRASCSSLSMISHAAAAVVMPACPATRVAIKCIEGVFNTTVDAKRTLREVRVLTSLAGAARSRAVG